MIHLLGNLGCEGEWRGAPPLPAHVAGRIAALATVMRALVDADAVTVWTAVAVEPARIPVVAGLPGVQLAVGTPPAGAPVLAWGATAAPAPPVPEAAITTALDPALRRALAEPAPSIAIARAVNDRALAHALARELGCALPGAAEAVTDAALAAAAGASPSGEWIAKLALTAAGRDRVRGRVPVDAATRTRLDRLAQLGPVVIEPWLARRLDLATVGAITDAGVEVLAPHTLVTDARGGFRGIDLARPPVDLDRVRAIAHAVGDALAARGHRGAYTVDALVDTAGQLHPLLEINARLSFGVVARALAARLAATRFTVGTDPPATARLLVAPTAADPSAAWLT